VCLNWASTDLWELRNEAADVFVMTGLTARNNPMYDHRYPTKTCGRSNLTVRSSWDNVTSPSGGRISREGVRRLPTPRRSGARVDGMANSGELLINVARSNKPKALTGLNQKVRGQVQRDFPSPVVVVRATGGEAEPKPSVIHPWNVVSPSSSLQGRTAARRRRRGGG
jgi:hypothetical protein